MNDEELLHAYRSTDYRAVVEGESITLRHGERSAALDAALELAGVSCWVFVTAWNPGRARWTREWNLRANHALWRDIAHRGWRLHAGEGAARDGSWSERSFLVFGPSREEACSLGARFGQWGVVGGARGEPAEVLELRTHPALASGYELARSSGAGSIAAMSLADGEREDARADALFAETYRLEPGLRRRRWAPMTSVLMPSVVDRADELLAALDRAVNENVQGAGALREYVAQLRAEFRREA